MITTMLESSWSAQNGLCIDYFLILESAGSAHKLRIGCECYEKGDENMTYEQKRCIFCEKTVPVTREGNDLVFHDCSCAGQGSYTMAGGFYEVLDQMSPTEKRDKLYLISSLIRETLEMNRDIRIGKDNFDDLIESSLIPVNMDEKKEKCLLYIYRNAQGPDIPVTLRPMETAYTITYSPNLQEFIYIIEELKAGKLLVRRGSALSLTPAGWKEGGRLAEKSWNRQCFLAVGREHGLLESFQEIIMPRLRENGFEPVTGASEEGSSYGTDKLISEMKNSEVVIADFTLQPRTVYYETGMAKGLGVPVIETVHKDSQENLVLNASEEGPIIWETPEELADMLQNRLQAWKSKSREVQSTEETPPGTAGSFPLRGLEESRQNPAVSEE